eukprot:TRINITY_DN1548_c1_g1_i1.p1 TRINITY_DN1548_c1_g1~~TRINITY_DN1548_c1_g1_i1.p1  ORF type:complete len:421 (+),score=43.02 TRINITY_DN1548_c1_g1_i1:149-1411(+)
MKGVILPKEKADYLHELSSSQVLDSKDPFESSRFTTVRIVGADGVGKYSLMIRMACDFFEEDKGKHKQNAASYVSDRTFKLICERNEQEVPPPSEGAVVLCFDLSRNFTKHTEQDLKNSMKAITQDMIGNDVKVFIVGNKLDVVRSSNMYFTNRRLSPEEVYELSRSGLCSFSKSIINNILSHLDVHDIQSFKNVSMYCMRFVDDDVVWKRLYIQNCSKSEQIPDIMTGWRECYRKRFSIDLFSVLVSINKLFNDQLYHWSAVQNTIFFVSARTGEHITSLKKAISFHYQKCVFPSVQIKDTMYTPPDICWIRGNKFLDTWKQRRILIQNRTLSRCSIIIMPSGTQEEEIQIPINETTEIKYSSVKVQKNGFLYQTKITIKTADVCKILFQTIEVAHKWHMQIIRLGELAGYSCETRWRY